MNLQEARIFVARFEKGGYSSEEHADFLRWVRVCSMSDLAEIVKEHEALAEHWSLGNEGPTSSWVEQLELKLDRAGDRIEVPVRRLEPVGSGRKWRWLAAASVLLVMSAAAWLWYGQKAGSGSGKQENSFAVLSNTAFTARGEQKQVLLPDGSKVWLNASSSLSYPVSFAGNERLVELKGEAFFEVAKNAAAPFRVKVRDMQIQVLGTHFNVMGYTDEPVCRTTLVEGAIKITRGKEAVMLEPGEQAVVTYPGKDVPMSLIRGVDPESVMAWKNGNLEFSNDDLPTVMRALSRAYNVDIQYQGAVPDRRFSGSFSKKDGLENTLKLLELQKIHFTLKDNTIIVTQ